MMFMKEVLIPDHVTLKHVLIRIKVFYDWFIRYYYLVKHEHHFSYQLCYFKERLGQNPLLVVLFTLQTHKSFVSCRKKWPSSGGICIILLHYNKWKITQYK